MKTPEKPVTPTLWSLAFTWELDSARAARVVDLYGKSDAGSAKLLAQWLNKHTSEIADDEVTAPWATALIHKLLSHVEIKAAGAIGQIENVPIPCRDCGMAFVSMPRGGRFARTCGECYSYEPSPIEHPRGGLIQVKRGDYPKRRRGQSLGVTEYGTSIRCAFPDCTTMFLATRRTSEYCEEHAQRREQARRLRMSGLTVTTCASGLAD